MTTAPLKQNGFDVPLKIEVAGKTDVGLVRPGNEDYLHIDRDHNVYAVCDGMGGHKAGEVASMTASETVQTAFAHFHDELLADPDLDLGATLPRSGELLIKSTRLANAAIQSRAERDPGLSGMGTTIVGIAVEDDVATIVHVGDSRAYRLDQDRLVPLTTDHSWVAEMARRDDVPDDLATGMIGKNVITRALGVRSTVEVDYRVTKLHPGDTFILCSDGLCGFADDEDIFAAANPVQSFLGKIVTELIQLANDRGGADNITVLALRVDEIGESNFAEADPQTVPAESQELLGVEDGWVDRMREFEQATPPPAESSNSGSNRTLMMLIFAAFIVVAGAIIYLSSVD
jgi:protein phosphatase